MQGETPSISGRRGVGLPDTFITYVASFTDMDTDQAWAAKFRRTRHIGDFSRWKDHDAYQEAFERSGQFKTK